MNTPRLISIVLIAIGFILLMVGISEADSFASNLSNLFTGSPTDNAIWLLIGGTVLVIVGYSGMLREKR